MDEQTVHPCEAVSQSGDHDSTETDESKDDDVKESSAGEKADGVGWRQTVEFLFFESLLGNVCYS